MNRVFGRKLLCFGSATLMTTLCVAVAQAQYVTTVRGSITDSSGAALAGASVELRSLAGSVLARTTSERDGSFSVRVAALDRYELAIAKPGFSQSILALSRLQVQAPLAVTLTLGTFQTDVQVEGRADDLIGVAQSAGQITVGAQELRTRPILRAGEILESLPGLIITQHAGGGKANQYFLRGFNLDHGTDFAIFLDGMPLNLPSHAHGEGYSDMNVVIPELVERIDAEKGPYYADVGDYGSAGNAEIIFFKTLPEDFVQVDGGMYQFARLVFGLTRALGAGHLLLGGEAYHDSGPWVHPDNFYKFNGLATYTWGDASRGLDVSARAYAGSRWNSSDQIPLSAVPALGLYGSLDPTDGGHSHRGSLQIAFHQQNDQSETTLTGYGFYYDLNLFSNFTYYLVDPYKGDQFEQQDRRWVAGFDLRHGRRTSWGGRTWQTTAGMQLRNDWIHNGLFRTEDRVRTSKTDYTANYSDNGWSPLDQIAVLPAATDLNKFTETLISPWVSVQTEWTRHLRTVLGARVDEGLGALTSFSNPTSPAYPNDPLPAGSNPNSGRSVSSFLFSPKASLIYDPATRVELYLQGGLSYHTNDVRGVTQQYEPVSPDYPFYNTPAPAKLPFLVQTRGAEVGIRAHAVSHLESTAELWYLHSNSELLQDGDTGGTTPSLEPSNRYGFEIGNFYTPTPHLAFDADFADSRARFTSDDPTDSTFYTHAGGTVQLCRPNSICGSLIPTGAGTYLQGSYGKQVPEAVRWVVASGATLSNAKGLSGSLRLRYFGPRALTSDGLYTSPPTALVNLQAGYVFDSHWQLVGEVLNLLDRRDDDVDYAYVSQMSPAAALGLPDSAPTTLAGQQQVASVLNSSAIFTRVLHPVEPIQARFTLRYTFHPQAKSRHG